MDQVGQQIERYQRYLAMDPNNRELLMAYGDALHANGQFAEAGEAFEKILGLAAGDAVAQSRLASVSMSNHDFASAERMLSQLLAAGAQDAALKFNLGLALYCQQKFAAAEPIFNELTAAEPMAQEARYYLISSLHNLQRNDEAIARAQQFLLQRPSPKLRGYLALVQWDASAVEEAVSQAKAVLEEQPDNTDAATVLGTYCIEQQRMEEAERHLQLLTDREPGNIRGWQGLGLIALYRQQYLQAIEHLRTAVEYMPNDVGNYNTLGWIYIITQQFAEAEQTFRQGLAIDRNVAEAHGGLAAALAYQNKIDAARREIALANGLDARGFGAQIAQSLVLKLQGQEQLGAEAFAKMLQAPLRNADSTLMDSLIGYWKKTKK